MTQSTVLLFPNRSNHCSDCSRAAHCLGLHLEDGNSHSTLDIDAHPRVLHKNEKLVNDGDIFQALYAVRSGAIKTYKTTETGEEQIIDFCLPGDIIGLDAIHTGHFNCHAVALDTSSICALDFNEIERLCEKSSAFRKAFLGRLSAGILRNENFVVTLGTRDAYERLAAFLVMLTEYYSSRGFSRIEFVLPMSRSDIADYLNLAVETVSRLFSRLQSENCLQVQRSAICVLNLNGLYQAAGMNPPHSSRTAHVK
jgi:CRP/FNR family transcriptional regulator, anaerobic regulatory protein